MEHFVLRIAASQQADNHEVAILAIKGGALYEEAKRLNLRCHVLECRNKALRAIKGGYILAKFRPGILHAHNQTSLQYAVLGKRVSGARVVLTNHGQGSGSPRKPSASEWEATDKIVAVSEAVAMRMDQAVLGGKITTIYNGVTASAARVNREDMRKELGIPEGRVVGTLAARIDGKKGHDTLLRALVNLQSSGVPVTMLIAGDGVERSNIESLSNQLGLTSDTIRFLGFRNDVPDLLTASDFFTLPSLTEGLPLSVLEAMSFRLPVVATAVGGIPELVTNAEHGLLIEVNDDLALADAIKTMVEYPEQRRACGNAGYQKVAARFTFEKMTSEYEMLYRGLDARLERAS